MGLDAAFTANASAEGSLLFASEGLEQQQHYIRLTAYPAPNSSQTFEFDYAIITNEVPRYVHVARCLFARSQRYVRLVHRYRLL